MKAEVLPNADATSQIQVTTSKKKEKSKESYVFYSDKYFDSKKLAEQSCKAWLSVINGLHQVVREALPERFESLSIPDTITLFKESLVKTLPNYKTFQTVGFDLVSQVQISGGEKKFIECLRYDGLSYIHIPQGASEFQGRFCYKDGKVSIADLESHLNAFTVTLNRDQMDIFRLYGKLGKEIEDVLPNRSGKSDLDTGFKTFFPAGLIGSAYSWRDQDGEVCRIDPRRLLEIIYHANRL